MKHEKGIKGYKVFNPDWTCDPAYYAIKQYTCPGKFEEDVELEVCNYGMHFCQNAVDCFNFYSFNPNNHVAEVIAYGNVLTEDNMSCTDKLEVVREIPWDEVLRIVNLGKNCTGRCNTGNCNTGDYNTGNCNTGDRNTGRQNTGCRNTGNGNTGGWNVGDWNVGDCNTGDRNTGNGNTGGWNVGDYNTGDYNTGNRNTGDWNKSSHNTGCFNTKEPKIILFNKPSDWTYDDWLRSDARFLLHQIPKNVVKWIYEKNMTDKEKAKYPTYKTTGGYLKALDESECAQLWWDSLPNYQKNVIKEIPNFDPCIFEQCTGIKIGGN